MPFGFEGFTLLLLILQDVDLVPTDIAAGLLLVSRKQQLACLRDTNEDLSSRQTYGDRHQALG